MWLISKTAMRSGTSTMSHEAERPLATYAAVVFKSHDLDPEFVSTIVGRSPTLSFRRGDLYNVNGASQNRRFGMWLYSTRNIIKSERLEVHLEVIEEVLIGTNSAWPDSRLNKIRALVVDQSAQLRVDVFWFGNGEAPFPKISRSFDQVVTMAGGTVERDFHSDGETVEAA